MSVAGSQTKAWAAWAYIADPTRLFGGSGSHQSLWAPRVSTAARRTCDPWYCAAVFFWHDCAGRVFISSGSKPVQYLCVCTVHAKSRWPPKAGATLRLTPLDLIRSAPARVRPCATVMASPLGPSPSLPAALGGHKPPTSASFQQADETLPHALWRHRPWPRALVGDEGLWLPCLMGRGALARAPALEPAAGLDVAKAQAGMA